MLAGLSVPVQSVLIDANVCITLIQADELHILNDIENHQFNVPDEVMQEVIRPPQNEILRQAIDSGQITRISITEAAELLLFADIRDNHRLGAGESACIAIAQSRGWSVATDELGRCRRKLLILSTQLHQNRHRMVVLVLHALISLNTKFAKL